MGTRLTEDGQVTIPDAIRDTLRLRVGDEVEFQVDDAGTVRVVRGGASERLERAFRQIAKDPPIKGITTDEIMDMTRGKDR